jgi:hypothetical protein
MPNWVYNELTISGSAEDIANIKEQLARPKPMPNGEASEERVISFWNIKHPPLDKLDEYHSTHGWANGEATGQTNYNWYVFNNREWGTKWDASDASLNSDTETSLSYSFSTAWSPPSVFTALSEQYPDATITLWYEEEQGWGGKIAFENGEENEIEEWDSPESHADYKDRDKEDQCCCNWDDDVEDWYDDCPDKAEKMKALLEETEQAVEKFEDISELTV